MAVYRRDTRSRFLLPVIIVSSLLLITIDSGNGSGAVASLRSTAHNIISPVQSVVNDAFQPLRDVAGGITTYGSLKQQNDNLRRQISDLRGQLRQTRGVGNELPELEKLLDLPTVQDAT